MKEVLLKSISGATMFDFSCSGSTSLSFYFLIGRKNKTEQSAILTQLVMKIFIDLKK